MTDESKLSYGNVTNLFVNRKTSGDSVVIGGTAEDASRWTRVLTYRAAQMLWFQLTRYLFPEKSEAVTALVTTTPLRSDSLPSITTHIAVDKVENGSFEISGWIGDQMWWLRLNDYETRRFWTALDMALYPLGWQGSGSKTSQ